MNLILFDVSGTLVHSTDFEHKVLLRTVGKVLDVPVDKLREFRKAETETAFVEKVWKLVRNDAITSEDWAEIYSIYHKTLLEEYIASKSRFTSLEGAPELLSNLQDSKSWAFAIATTAWHDMAHLSLRSAGFYTRRFHVVTGEGVTKKSQLLEKAIQSSKRWYGVNEFSKITYVGDEALDNAVCREMKIPFIEVSELQEGEESQKRKVRYPEKGQFIRLARRAAVPTRLRSQGLVSLIGIRG
ncbi:MAG: HAD hydrolase-like protein [Flavobacteriia bacterium]|nr:HAD hydrolase-like protein [Flavobacteriia bacterium]